MALGAAVVALSLGASSCSVGSGGSCSGSPSKPKTVRTASFFGRVTADPDGWSISQPGVAEARMVIAGHAVETDADTQRLGYCYSNSNVFDPNACAAFVGVRTHSVAAWVLLAVRTGSAGQKGALGSEAGRFELSGTTIWKVDTDALVLSEGVRLPFGAAFAAKLRPAGAATRSTQSTLENDGVGATISVDPQSGEVLDAGANGCA